MRTHKGKNLLIVGGVVILIVVAAIAALLSFDVTKFKSAIESAAFDATGLEVGINGKMGYSFFPFGISAKEIRATSKGSEIISLETLTLGLELMPLLKKQLKVNSCELVKPVVTIVKASDGTYNFERAEKKSTHGSPGAAFSVNDLRLTNGVLVYLDKTTEEKTEIKDFNLAVKDLSIAGNNLKNASFTGSLYCREIRKKSLIIDNVRSPITAKKGVISLIPLTLDIFGSKGEGNASADTSKAHTLYKISVKVSKLDFAKLEESFGRKRVIGGKGELIASLSMAGKGNGSLLSSMDGTISLRGEHLVTYTMDLDKVLSSYETSQEFNLVDLGAFFIAGPLSTLVLKGYRYGDVYNQTRGGQGVITQFISTWAIRDNRADALDCALATRHNRVALRGRIDLVSERYDNVIVALLDDKGCAKFYQGISGSFGSPKIGAVSRVESLAGPIFKLYRQTKRFVQGGNCEVFYGGTVPQPPE